MPELAMDAAEADLWRQVERLWRLARTGELEPIAAALHPAYSGWVTGQDRPHDRQAALAAVGPAAPAVLGYALTPLAVRVIEGRVGIAHYRYAATIDAGAPADVAGRWTEVYLRKKHAWVMVAVSGGPDGQR